MHPSRSAGYSALMQRLKLPIGIQTFREIREDGHYYVDKTPHILHLVEGGGDDTSCPTSALVRLTQNRPAIVLT